MIGLLQRAPTAGFITLTLLIALLPFAVFWWRELDPFADPRALPLLLVMVWSPNLAALIVSAADGSWRALLGTFARLPRGATPWLWAATPLLVIAAVGGGRGGAEVPASSVALLLGMNLILGPLGEELGWRGYLLPRLLPAWGTLGAALIVGIVWALWHLPLWAIDSPQAAMPFWIFAATVLCFSVILTAIWTASGGSLWPSVLFHLLANCVVGWVELRGGSGVATYTAALPWYAGVALAAAGWTWWQVPKVCPA